MAKKKPRRRLQKKVVKNCYFCENKKNPNLEDVSELSKFLTERGKIVPRMRSGLCAKHQKKLTKAVKHARHLALLSFVVRG